MTYACCMSILTRTKLKSPLNYKYENVRTTRRPRKRWISGILEALGNVTAEEANEKAEGSNLSLPSTLRDN
jgi:hypothetical protein